MKPVNLIKSFFFFFCSQFFKKRYDVIIQNSSQFNNQFGESQYFSNIIKTLDTKNLKFVVFEQNEFNIKNIRSNDKFIPSDFIYLINMFFNKSIGRINSVFSRKIKNSFNKFLFRNIKTRHIITIGNCFIEEYISIFSGVNIFDFQHGMIYKNHKGYNFFLQSNYKIFMHGDIYRNFIQDSNPKLNNNLITIGHPYLKKKQLISFKNRNKIVIYSLLGTWEKNASSIQIQTEIEHEDRIIKDCVKYVANSDLKVIYKLHPRSVKNVLSEFDYGTQFKVVNEFPINKMEETFLHITIASTSVFDFSSLAVPTFMSSYLPISVNRMRDEFKFPLIPKLSLSDQLDLYINDQDKYQKDSLSVFNWYWDNHIEYSEDLFLKSIRT